MKHCSGCEEFYRGRSGNVHTCFCDTLQSTAKPQLLGAGESVSFSTKTPQVIKSENVICYDVDDTLILWEESSGFTWDKGFTPDGEARSAATSESEREARATREGSRSAATRLGVTCPHDGKPLCVNRHEPHIKLLMNHKARGKTIIVWSQGGYQWAEAVVKALGLTEHVDFIMSKPRAYVDDLPVQEWMKDRIYINPDSNWGQGLEKSDENS